METTPGNIEPLKNLESKTYPKEAWPEGEYAIEVTRTPDHSSVDFIFDTEEEAANLARRLHNPSDERDLYEGDKETMEKWRDLNRLLSAPAKLHGPFRVDGDKFRIRIIANYEKTEDFRKDVVSRLVGMNFIPESVLDLLS